MLTFSGWCRLQMGGTLARKRSDLYFVFQRSLGEKRGAFDARLCQ